MMANDRLEQLLDLWMADRDRGIIRTASEICTENPELVEELSRRIEIVRRFELLADVDHSETLVSQGSVDTSHLTNAPVPTALKPTTMPGSIGPFRPLELLGEGGMGAVYLAEDPQLGRRVAVKVMKKELAADSDARHRFLREARAMATVEHDNIMTIYAVGEDQGMPYLVMPVLKGETLDDRLRRESRLSADETRRIGEEIAAGLAAAHSHGLIHRDIKPSNIWLEGTQGRVRILDFGLARPASDDQKVTHSGAVLGTPAYMAPEQAAGAAATPRSDLFSLGAVLYRMTTGVQPFAGPNIMATLSNLANKQPEPPRKICPEVPESLSELILRLIAKPPEDRPESAAIVVESLQPTLETVVPHFTFSPSPVRSRKKPAGRPSVDQPLNKVASSTRPPRTFRKGLAAGFAGFLVLMSIIVYRIQTDKGVLIVSIDDEQVAAKLTKGGLEIEDAKTGRTWTIKPDQPESVSSGEYKISPPDGLLLYVTDDTGTEFTTAEFKIKRGDQITVRVTREEPEGSVVVNPEWNGWPKDAPAPAIAPFDAAQAKRHQEEWAKHLGVPVEYTNSIGMKFVLIPPGEFLMGSTSAEIEDLLTQIADAESVLDRLQLESPQHRVVMTKAFYLGVHEVTQAQFAGVMGNNPSFHSSTGGGKDLVLQIDTSAYPVEQVSWNDTTEFCRRLSLQENVVPATSEPNRDSTTPNGSGYWLPTEAEWEFACRAGTTTWFWNGNGIENLKTIDLFGPTTGQVGQLKANPFGVHDLHGNVCEFVHDCWDPDSYKKHSGEPAIDPIGGVPEAHALTLYRGSHWSGCDESARSAARKVGYERSTPVASHLGFRVKLPWTTVKEFLRSENSRLHSAAGHTRHVPVGPSPFDALSYSQVPETERLDYVPKDVVAVLGTHEQKTWAAPGRYLRQTIGTLDYSPDGKWICACDWSNAYLFDATNLLLKSTIQNVPANLVSRRPLVFSPDSKSLFVGGIASNPFWGTAVVDLTTTEPSVKLLPMSDACLSGNAIAVAEQGDFVSYVDSAGTAIGTATRDPITGTMGKRAILPDHEEISDILKSRGIGELAFSPDAEWLVTGYVGGGYQIFRRHSTDNGEFRPVDFIQTQPLGNGEMRAAFSFTASHKRALLVEVANCRLLDLSLLDNLAEDMPVPPHLSLELDPPKELTNIKDISISRDGQTWVASQAVSDSCSQLLIGNWVDGRPEVQKSIDLPNCFAGRVALSPDASSVAVLANGHVLQVIDLTQNPPIKRPSLDETRMASNSDLSRTITVGTDGVIRLDATTPEKHEVLDSRQLDLGWADVRMSDDGKRAVSISVGDLNISKRSRIYVWNLEQDKLDKFAEFELSEGRENAWPVLFAQGTRLLYGNQIWDISLPSPTVISDFVQLPPNPAASAVTEDGRLVAFATPDGQLALYATLGSVDRPLTTKKLPSSPASLSFSPDGRRLVALFAGGIGTVWDLADGQLTEARQLPAQWQIPPGGPPYHMTSAVFSRDDHRVYFSGWGGVGEWNLDENKVTRFWPLPGFATLTMANDDRHLILNNSNCTTWVLRLTEP